MDPSLQLLQGLLFALVIAFFSYWTRLLTRSGAAAQCVLGALLLGFGGWAWTVPILVFFLGSAAISRVGREKRRPMEKLFVKSGSRDLWQVLANGGVAGILCLLWVFDPEPVTYIASLGALGAAAADTWGTELGTLSRRQPRLVTTLRPVEAGVSGGVTLLGTGAGGCGAALVVLSGLPWVGPDSTIPALLAGVAGGIGGSLIDSLLGATLQRQYRCPACGRTTEGKNGCSHPDRIQSGLTWMTNDAVNLIATASGALLAAALFLALA